MDVTINKPFDHVWSIMWSIDSDSFTRATGTKLDLDVPSGASVQLPQVLLDDPNSNAQGTEWPRRGRPPPLDNLQSPTWRRPEAEPTYVGDESPTTLGCGSSECVMVWAFHISSHWQIGKDIFEMSLFMSALVFCTDDFSELPLCRACCTRNHTQTQSSPGAEQLRWTATGAVRCLETCWSHWAEQVFGTAKGGGHPSTELQETFSNLRTLYRFHCTREKAL